MLPRAGRGARRESRRPRPPHRWCQRPLRRGVRTWHFHRGMRSRAAWLSHTLPPAWRRLGLGCSSPGLSVVLTEPARWVLFQRNNVPRPKAYRITQRLSWTSVDLAPSPSEEPRREVERNAGRQIVGVLLYIKPRHPTAHADTPALKRPRQEHRRGAVATSRSRQPRPQT